MEEKEKIRKWDNATVYKVGDCIVVIERKTRTGFGSFSGQPRPKLWDEITITSKNSLNPESPASELVIRTAEVDKGVEPSTVLSELEN